MKNTVLKCLLMALLFVWMFTTVCYGSAAENPTAEITPLITVSTSPVAFDAAEKQKFNPYQEKELELVAFPGNTVFKLTPSSGSVVYQVKANNYCEKVNGAWSWIEHLFETTELRNVSAQASRKVSMQTSRTVRLAVFSGKCAAAVV